MNALNGIGTCSDTLLWLKHACAHSRQPIYFGCHNNHVTTSSCCFRRRLTHACNCEPKVADGGDVWGPMSHINPWDWWQTSMPQIRCATFHFLGCWPCWLSETSSASSNHRLLAPSSTSTTGSTLGGFHKHISCGGCSAWSAWHFWGQPDFVPMQLP